MIFTDLVAGDSVFLDANTLIYHFGPHPAFGPACNQEVSNLPGWSLAGAKQRLRRQPTALQGLSQFRQAIESVLTSRLQVLTIAPALIAAAAAVSQQTGLLSNDALIVAILQHHSLTKLASLDTDFDRVPGLTRYAPA
jgi:predicted nucleic acid-binding protein